jgi:hypothetical protein
MMEFESIELPDVEFSMPDGIFIKQMLLARSGMYVPQHSHAYDHTSMLAAGSIRVWCNDELVGDFKAPKPISIEAGTKHTFMSLEPSTIVYCIHNLRDHGLEIESEHTHVSESILSQGE